MMEGVAIPLRYRCPKCGGELFGTEGWEWVWCVKECRGASGRRFRLEEAMKAPTMVEAWREMERAARYQEFVARIMRRITVVLVWATVFIRRRMDMSHRLKMVYFWAFVVIAGIVGVVIFGGCDGEQGGIMATEQGKSIDPGDPGADGVWMEGELCYVALSEDKNPERAWVMDFESGEEFEVERFQVRYGLVFFSAGGVPRGRAYEVKWLSRHGGFGVCCKADL